MPNVTISICYFAQMLNAIDGIHFPFLIMIKTVLKKQKKKSFFSFTTNNLIDFLQNKFKKVTRNKARVYTQFTLILMS